MDKKRKNILMVAAVAASSAAAVSIGAYFTTKYLVRLALDRQQPKIPHRAQTRLRGYDNCAMMLEKTAPLGKKLQETTHHLVNLRSYDEELLVGHWFPCANPKRVIVAMHGWRSSWNGDFGAIADFWKKQNCSVLYAEQRGQGQSGGQYMGFGMIERYDCLEWAKWVCTQTPEHLPVYLAGVSMGATTVLLTANMDLPPRVKGIMADCGFTSAHSIFKHVAGKNLRLPYKLHDGFANRQCLKKTGMGTKACSTVEALAQSKVPVLFAHGTDDHFVPVEMTYENYTACSAPKRLLIVPGADHGMSYFMEKQRYEQAVLDFWAEFDSDSTNNAFHRPQNGV